MAIIPLPTKFDFTRVERFGLQRATNVLRSRYTGQGQRIVYPYAVWVLEASLVDYDEPQAGLLRSFLVQLEGQKNTFRLPVPGYRKPNTSNGNLAVPPTMRVYEGGGTQARASSFNFVIGQGNYIDYTIGSIFNEGDYFTIGDELKMVTQAIATGGPDVNLVNFKPALRKSYPHLTPITWINPTVLMHAAEDDVAEWSLTAPIRHGVNFNAIEAVEI